MLWNVSMIMYQYFETNKLKLRFLNEGSGSTKVLELGAGMGHVWFAMKEKFGCEVVWTESKTALPLLKESIDQMEKLSS